MLYDLFVSGNLTAALDIPTLEKHNINRILTVDTCPLPRTVTYSPNISIKLLQSKYTSYLDNLKA